MKDELTFFEIRTDAYTKNTMSAMRVQSYTEV